MMDIFHAALRQISKAARINTFGYNLHPHEQRENIASCVAAIHEIEQIPCGHTRMAMTIMLQKTYRKEVVRFAQIALSDNKGQL